VIENELLLSERLGVSLLQRQYNSHGEEWRKVSAEFQSKTGSERWRHYTPSDGEFLLWQGTIPSYASRYGIARRLEEGLPVFFVTAKKDGWFDGVSCSDILKEALKMLPGALKGSCKVTWEYLSRGNTLPGVGFRHVSVVVPGGIRDLALAIMTVVDEQFQSASTGLAGDYEFIAIDTSTFNRFRREWKRKTSVAVVSAVRTLTQAWDILGARNLHVASVRKILDLKRSSVENGAPIALVEEAFLMVMAQRLHYGRTIQGSGAETVAVLDKLHSLYLDGVLSPTTRAGNLASGVLSLQYSGIDIDDLLPQVVG